MKKIFLIILIPGLWLISSCEKKFLETLPKGLVIAQNTSDFRKLLDNADTRYTYNVAQTSGFIDVVSDDAQLDSSWYEWERERLHAKHLYAFEKEVWLPDGANNDDTWKQNYYINNLMSNILEEIHIAKDNQQLQLQLIAEAKVHRAFAYLTLVNVYAKHYNPSTASNDPGVPLFTNPVDLPNLKRASVQEVYKFILAELLAAVDNLPSDVDNQYSHRPTKVSTYAILSRAYLYMGDYPKALEYADKSLAIKSFLYDYNNIYTGEPRAANLKGISRISDEEMLLHKTTIKSARLSDYYMLDTVSFNQLYDGFEQINDSVKVNNDLRRVLRFEGFNSNGDLNGDRARYVFSRRRYTVDNAIVDYMPISTPEMYLVRAECYARSGNLDKAVADLNTLRKNRFRTGSYTNMSAAGVDQSFVLNEVLKERRRELYGRDLRLFDIKRLSLPVSHLQPGTMQPGFSVPANDPKLVWPIFYHVIDLNPEIAQNPR